MIQTNHKNVNKGVRVYLCFILHNKATNPPTHEMTVNSGQDFNTNLKIWIAAFSIFLYSLQSADLQLLTNDNA